MALLRNGAHLMQSNGLLLGNVVGSNGVIVGNAAFTSIAAATTMATVAASLGTSVALAAVQLQLVRIQKAVERVGARIDVLLDESREVRSSEIETRIDRVIRESRWAIELGRVPESTLEELRGDGHALESYCRSTVRLLGRRVDSLGRGAAKAADRHEVLRREAGHIARDAVNLHAAADCWLGYELLRAGALGQSDPEYAELIARSASERTDEWRQRAAEQVAVLQQRLRRIDAAPGKGLSSRTKRAVSDIAGQLAEAVADAIPDVEPPTPTAIEVVGLGAEQRDDLLQELRWRTDDGLVMLLSGVAVPRTKEIGGIDVARGAPRAITNRDGFIAIRAARVVVGIAKDFVEDGSVLLDAPRADCEVVDYDAKTGAFELGCNGESVRVEPYERERRKAPSLVYRRVREARELVPLALTSTGSVGGPDVVEQT
ncbi:hypothetical protein CWIS_12880 [Cellulomonas sp. A375-1]|nr:hypothetical protein CWIS_12880 [Cellulomonas sp. A375-1]